jgi:peptidoglycan/xylan/chitin deacetylase (PgdA/CDA1 family)
VGSRALQRIAQVLREHRSVILCYHGVGSTHSRIDPGFLRVRLDVFRAQLDLLLEAGFEFVTVAELVDRARGAVPPPGLAALSFDDGMDDNHEVVLPVLRELHVPATVYVATGLIGKPNPWLAPDSAARMMTEAELQELVTAGIEIGAHSVTHPDLSRLDFESCLSEMTESRRTLERVTGQPVRTFAYPYCRYGAEALAAVRAAGFSAAVTCQGLGSWDPYTLKRSLITGKDALPTFLLKLTDLYQPLFDSVPSRLVRSATRGLRDRRRERVETRRERNAG